MRRLRTLSLFVAVIGLASTVTAPAASGGTPSAMAEHGCVRAAARTASAIGTTSCSGVRPGALVEVPSVGAFCTLGFVHYDSKKQWYITTAGHCAFPDSTESAIKVWSPGEGPTAYTSSGKPIGRFVFAGLKGDLDIGVILVSKSVTPKAQVCHFGGPTGLTTSQTRNVVEVNFYGHADGASLIVPARSGVAMGMRDPKYVYALTPSWFGDSGGPALTGGKAIGYTVGIGYAITIGADPWAGSIFIARLGPQMSQAEKYLKKKLYLKTAPRR